MDAAKSPTEKLAGRTRRDQLARLVLREADKTKIQKQTKQRFKVLINSHTDKNNSMNSVNHCINAIV